MNAFALISLISFVVCLLLGTYVYIKEVRYTFKNELAKYFVLTCLSFALSWALIEFGYRTASSFKAAFFWSKLNVAWYIVISLILHFTLILTNNVKLLRNKLTYFLIYGPTIIFVVVDIETTLLLTDPIKAEWGWMFGIPENPITYGISSTWAICTIIFSLIICIEHIRNTQQSYKRKQVKLATLGLLLPTIVGFHTEYLFPIMNIKVPELVVPSLTIGLIIIWHSIWHHSSLEKKHKYNIIQKEVDSFIKTTASYFKNMN